MHSEEGATIRGKQSNSHKGRNAGQAAQIRSGDVKTSQEDEDVDARRRHEVSNQLWVNIAQAEAEDVSLDELSHNDREVGRRDYVMDDTKQGLSTKAQ